MTRIEYLNCLLPIIYPKFYTLLSPSLDELVFLHDGDPLPSFLDKEGKAIANYISDDRTQFEATNNHFHLFDKVGEAYKEMSLDIGKAIANNLLGALNVAFPKKKFVVYLEVNPKTSTILRFHQIWDGESPYLDVKQTYQDDLKLFEFRSI